MIDLEHFDFDNCYKFVLHYKGGSIGVAVDVFLEENYEDYQKISDYHQYQKIMGMIIKFMLDNDDI